MTQPGATRFLQAMKYDPLAPFDDCLSRKLREIYNLLPRASGECLMVQYFDGFYKKDGFATFEEYLEVKCGANTQIAKLVMRKLDAIRENVIIAPARWVN